MEVNLFDFIYLWKEYLKEKKLHDALQGKQTLMVYKML